jgi:hypothetical protein
MTRENRRIEINPDIEGVVRELVHDLGDLHEAKRDDQSRERRRDRLKLALMSFDYWLSAGVETNFPLLDLLELAGALDDLDEGIVPDLLKPAKRAPGRPIDESRFWEPRGRFVAALKLLKLAGMKEDDATSYLVKKYKPKLEPLSTPKSNSRGNTKDLATRILNWHNTFEANGVISPFALGAYQQFENFRETVSQASPECREAVAKQVVDVMITRNFLSPQLESEISRYL